MKINNPDMKKVLITYSILLLSVVANYGQDIQKSTFQWMSNSYFDISTGLRTTQPTIVISFPDRVEWKSADGAIIQTFKISEVNGKWEDVSKDGEIIYEVDNQGKPCLAQFQRRGSMLTVWLILFSGATRNHYQFEIDSVTKL